MLVLVNGPHTNAKDDSKIVLPNFMQYPQMECEIVVAGDKIDNATVFHAAFALLLIGNKAGVSLGIDEDTGKEMRLITPSDILLIL